MAKFVVAGRSDCPYFARAELLGDRLARNLNKFKLHKIMVQPHEWDDWLKKTCAEKGWEFSKSPIVWRELIDRGGKGVLIGGANEFQEYAKAYYDLESDMNSYDMRTISNENKTTKDELDKEETEYKALSCPVHVCITNATNSACYHMAAMLTSGQVLGPDVELTIRFLVKNEEDLEQVRGLAMETEDLAHSNLRGVKVTCDLEEGFKDCSYIIMLDEINQEEGELKVEWLKRNHAFFNNYATVINKHALPSCKVMLAGNGPLNFNAMAVQKNAPNLARQNIVAVSTVIENQAKAVIGDRLSVNPAGVVNLLVWGNVNSKHFFDVNQCRIHGYDGAVWGPYWHSVDAREMVHDNKWLAREFPSLVAARAQKMSDAVGRAKGLSKANAICTMLQYWCRGSPQGQVFSLGVYSERWYKIPEGLYFSFPVTMDPKGFWHVVQDIEITHDMSENILAAVQDLKLQEAIFKGDISELDKGKKEGEENTDTTEEKDKDGEAVTDNDDAAAAAAASEATTNEAEVADTAPEGATAAEQVQEEKSPQDADEVNQGETTSVEASAEETPASESADNNAESAAAPAEN